MKVFTSFILSFIIFLASFQNSLIFLDYQVNRDFYEEHCINKDKPEMDCHGKCELKEQTEQNSTTYVVLKNFDFNFIPPIAVKINKTSNKLIINKQKLFSNTDNTLSDGHFFSYPKPPEA